LTDPFTTGDEIFAANFTRKTSAFNFQEAFW
jgi:hypothetical protein